MDEAGPAQRLGPLHRLIGLAQLGLFATVLYSVEKMGYGPRPSSAPGNMYICKKFGALTIVIVYEQIIRFTDCT